jgi:hypothetical protein
MYDRHLLNITKWKLSLNNNNNNNNNKKKEWGVAGASKISNYKI